MKLNLGCGPDIKEGYINIDLRNLPGVDIVANIDNLPFENNDIDEIYACDVLEHVSHLKTVEILTHWYKKLKVGGLLFIQSPCLELLCKYALNARDIRTKIVAIARFYGGQDYSTNYHYTTIDPDVLSYYLKEAGFTKEPRFQIGGFGNGTNIRVWINK